MDRWTLRYTIGNHYTTVCFHGQVSASRGVINKWRETTARCVARATQETTVKCTRRLSFWREASRTFNGRIVFWRENATARGIR